MLQNDSDLSVIPAKAGISCKGTMSLRHETPASAGVTGV